MSQVQFRGQSRSVEGFWKREKIMVLVGTMFLAIFHMNILSLSLRLNFQRAFQDLQGRGEGGLLFLVRKRKAELVVKLLRRGSRENSYGKRKGFES